MKQFNFNHKTEAFNYQINAITQIEGDHPVALFDEQGLGKTKMVIAGLLEDMKNKLIDSALIVCKKTLLKTWENEIETHSHLKSITLTGGIKERKKYFITFSRFYLINYESLIQEQELISELLQIKKFAMVLDESHKIKNPESKITQTIMQLREFTHKNIIISGTPVANAPEDLWAQFYFLDKGKLLGDDFNNFKKEYGVKISMGKNEVDELNLKELQDKLKEFAIRRTKKIAAPNLPLKHFIEKSVILTGKQKKMYDELKDELLIEIKNMDGQTINDEADNILKRLLRLTQIASNPKLIDLNYNEEPAKFKLLDKLIKEIIDKKQKVIIWSSFVNNILILKQRYKLYNSLTLYGGMKIVDRNKVVKWFQEDEDYKVLIANPSAAKEGLTLTSANHAIYLDRTFNSVDYLQSQDRIHRVSQKKECFITILIAKDTIDEYINEMLMKKNEIAKFIQGDTDEIVYPQELLSKDRLINILGGEKND